MMSQKTADSRWFWLTYVSVVCNVLLFFPVHCSCAEIRQNTARPNVLVILCDDLGIGDVGCFNPESKIATPHLDRLAAEGMRFTDAHTGSAVCSPTRYGLMTGRYAWRTRLQNGVLGGLSPSLIAPDRLTVASLLREQGYVTACVGKWHLGMDWVKQPGKEVSVNSIETREQVWNVDYAQPFTGGPLAAGFQRYYGISGSLDMVPYAWIRDDRIPVYPSEEHDFPMMLGRADGKTRLGPTSPGFEATDTLPGIVQESVAVITDVVRDNSNRPVDQQTPFFLYIPLNAPHTPILPTAEWQGRSGLNAYADFTMQTDAAIGEILKSLDEHGLTETTLVIVTSDNGCSPQADFPQLKALGHDPSAGYRGHKADIFEGGHRVPFVVRWPPVVKPDSISETTICLTDLFATIAEITGQSIPENAAEDSFSFLHVLRNGDSPAQHNRPPVVHHSINGSFAIRDGDWKLIFCGDSGGWSDPKPGRKTASAEGPRWQLYNLRTDRGEQSNIINEHPQIVERLTQVMKEFISNGRSTNGEHQPNDVEVKQPAGF